VITLLSNTRSQDATGVWRDGEETKREIFCQVDSVSRAEFFAAGQSGLWPEYRFTVFFGDYQGETRLLYNGARYAVYRTYHARTDELELYVQREVGVHGQ
jgi:hypothetical protein